jgi:hypothetical protein
MPVSIMSSVSMSYIKQIAGNWREIRSWSFIVLILDACYEFVTKQELSSLISIASWTLTWMLLCWIDRKSEEKMKSEKRE